MPETFDAKTEARALKNMSFDCYHDHTDEFHSQLERRLQDEFNRMTPEQRRAVMPELKKANGFFEFLTGMPHAVANVDKHGELTSIDFKGPFWDSAEDRLYDCEIHPQPYDKSL